MRAGRFGFIHEMIIDAITNNTFAHEPRAMRPPAVGLGGPVRTKAGPWVALAGRRNWPPAQNRDQVPQKIFLGCYQGSRCTPHTVAATWLLRFPSLPGLLKPHLWRRAVSLFNMRGRPPRAGSRLRTLATELPGSPRQPERVWHLGAQTR